MIDEPCMGSVLRKIRALGSDVDAVTLSDATQLVLDWAHECSKSKANEQSLPPCRFVVTPNLDHAVLLRKNQQLRAAYRDAALVLADGFPLVWASRIFGRPLPERVAGSDLTPAVLKGAPEGLEVFLLGAAEEVSRTAALKIQQECPQLQVVGRLSPPPGFEHDASWSERIVSAIRQSGASLVIVGLGAPKQELWVHEHSRQLPGTVVLCVGATIDFLADHVPRAPNWVQSMHLEWMHRMLNDPKRLVRRYARDLLVLPLLLMSDARYSMRSGDTR